MLRCSASSAALSARFWPCRRPKAPMQDLFSCGREPDYTYNIVHMYCIYIYVYIYIYIYVAYYTHNSIVICLHAHTRVRRFRPVSSFRACRSASCARRSLRLCSSRACFAARTAASSSSIFCRFASHSAASSATSSRAYHMVLHIGPSGIILVTRL